MSIIKEVFGDGIGNQLKGKNGSKLVLATILVGGFVLLSKVIIDGIAPGLDNNIQDPLIIHDDSTQDYEDTDDFQE